MSKYNQLNNEIVIDIEQGNNNINNIDSDIGEDNLIPILLRNQKNETSKVLINKLSTKLIKELKLEVLYYLQR